MKKMNRFGGACPASSAASRCRNGWSATAPAPSVTPLSAVRRSSRPGVTIFSAV